MRSSRKKIINCNFRSASRKKVGTSFGVPNIENLIFMHTFTFKRHKISNKNHNNFIFDFYFK